MEKIYCYSTNRGKFQKEGKTASALKKQLSFEKGNFCYLHTNDKEFKLSQLQLEHKIPVELGGHLFAPENIELACDKCHREKTQIDKAIIKSLKNLKIIWNSGDGEIYSIFTPKELEEIYYKLKKGFSSYKIYTDGTNGIDYEQILIKSNRE